MMQGAVKYTSCIVVLALLLYILDLQSDVNKMEAYSQISTSNNNKFDWIPFESNQGINVTTIGHESIPVFLLYGETGIQNEGFSSYQLFDGSFIVVSTGIINKTSQSVSGSDPQFTISFNIMGENNNYTVTFVNGRLFEEEWSENNYYVPMTENSTKIINLPELINTKLDKYIAIEKIIVGLEKNAQARQIIFSISLVKNYIPGNLTG